GDDNAKAANNAPAAVPPLPAELKVLERYVGAWEGTSTIKPGPWTPQEVQGKGSAVFKWALGGRFLQIDATSSDGQALGMMTYDPARKEFRSWQFHSAHGASEA